MHPLLIWTLLTVPTLSVSDRSPAPARMDEHPELRKVAVAAGVELHYVERGKGDAVIFIHGSLGDYSAWDGQLGPFAELYHAIAYSRRYNFSAGSKAASFDHLS